MSSVTSDLEKFFFTVLLLVNMTKKSPGVYFDPTDSTKRICTANARHQCLEAILDVEKWNSLMKHFGFKRRLLVCIEHAILFALYRELPEELRKYKQLWDESRSPQHEEGGAKVFRDSLRPDLIFFIPKMDGNSDM